MLILFKLLSLIMTSKKGLTIIIIVYKYLRNRFPRSRIKAKASF